MSHNELKTLAFFKAIYSRFSGLHETKQVWKHGASKMKFSTVTEGLEKIKDEYLNSEVLESEFADYLVLHFDECFDAVIDPTLAILAIQEFRQWNYKLEGETFGGTEELSENEFYGFIFKGKSQKLQLPDGIRVGIQTKDGGIALDEGIIPCFSKEEESLAPCDCMVQDTEEDTDENSISPFSAAMFTEEKMHILKTQSATAVIESSYSETMVGEMCYCTNTYIFDNNDTLIVEENYGHIVWGKEKFPFHEYHRSCIIDGSLIKLEQWKSGVEKLYDEIHQPIVQTMFELAHRYKKDPLAYALSVKLSQMSASAQTFLEREMPYLIA